MKKIFSTLLLLFAFVFIAQTSYSQGFPYHLYDPRTLAELVELNVIEANKLKDDGTKKIMISANPFYSAIRLEYARKSRVIAKEKLNLFKIWQESLEVDSRLFSILDKEFLFKECGKEYWIPVQKQVAAYFPKELKSGDMITLYLMYPGGLKIKPATTWNFLFLVNEFQKYQD
jgi:hypothetical protein